MPPLVSIATAVYNQRRFLKQRVASVLLQTMTDWEWTIVDDASTDGSFELLVELTKHDPRIRVLRAEKNQGVSITNQRAIDEATGEFLYRTDGDDYCFPRFLEVTSSMLQRDPMLAFVAIRSLRLDSHDRVSHHYPPKPHWRLSGQEVFARNIVSYQFASPSLMFRTDIVRQAGGFNALHLKTAQDWVLALRCCTFGDVEYRDEPLVAYRHHPTMTSKSFVKSSRPQELLQEHFAPIEDGLAWASAKWPKLNGEQLRSSATREHARRLLANAITFERDGRVEEAAMIRQEVAKRLEAVGLVETKAMKAVTWRNRVLRTIQGAVPKRKLPRAWVPEWENVLI